MIIYLAGKMTGCDNFNYPAFHEYARRLRAKGHVVRNPAEEFDGAQDRKRSEYMDKAYMRIRLQGPIRQDGEYASGDEFHPSDAIALLPLPDRDAWRSSDGAFFEMHLALIHDLPVYYADDLERGDASPLDRQVIRDFVNPPSNRVGGKVTPINHDTTDPRGTIMVEGGIQPHEREEFAVGDRVVTIGGGAGYLPGGLIGTVREVVGIEQMLGVEFDAPLPGGFGHRLSGLLKNATGWWMDASHLLRYYPPKTPHASTGEVRVVDPKTGGEKGTKLARYGLVPMRAWDEVVKAASYYPDGPDMMPVGAWVESATSELEAFIERDGDDATTLAELGVSIMMAIGGAQVALDALAEVYGYGAQKYANRNWERGYAWELSISACYRHLRAFRAGQEDDPESKLPHLAHALFHVLALLTFLEYNLGTDDRSELYKGGA